MSCRLTFAGIPLSLRMPRPCWNRLVVLASFAVAAGCRVPPSARSGTHYEDPLAKRAATLIEQLLARDGEIVVTYQGPYMFITDQSLLEDIARLEGHALEPLSDCLGDTRESRMTFQGDQKRTRHLLRGAVCGEIAIHTDYFQERRSDDLPLVSYDATAHELQQAQAKWRLYAQRIRAGGGSLLPRATPEKVGCYQAQLHAGLNQSATIDTAARIYFELDTLPLPGTVRPSMVEIGPGLTVDAEGRWNAFFEKAVNVIWSNERDSTYAQLVFGRTDVANGSYYVFESIKPRLSLTGKSTVVRVACDTRRLSGRGR